jgi:hypothetical protein
MEHSGRGGNTVEHGRKVRNALLECMMSLGGAPTQNRLEMGRRGEKTRGYVLHKWQDDRSENDAHAKE